MDLTGKWLPIVTGLQWTYLSINPWRATDAPAFAVGRSPPVRTLPKEAPMVLSLDEIRDLIRAEEAEDGDYIHLTSNETLLSPLAQSVLSSPLGNRYLLEHLDMRQDSPSRLNGFVYRGMNRVNAIEQSATEVCRQMFGAKYVEFRCLSGLHAMQSTMVSLTQPGDTIMRFGVADGGHFATETIIKLYGRKSCTYAFDRDKLTLDLAATAEVVRREKPRLAYLDAMNYLFPFPIRELREILGPDVPILYDASHTLGLIAGGRFQNPLAEGADILQANTHKTFFGPQKGIILSNNRELMERVSYYLSQGLVSSQHTANLLALCIALHEAQKFGADFARDIIGNAQFLAGEMAALGLPVLARDDGQFTENHHFFLNFTGRASASHEMEKLLAARLVVQRGVPFRNVDALRVGVQEVTRRGYTREELRQIAGWFADVLLRDVAPETLAPAVIALARQHTAIHYCDTPPVQPPVARPVAVPVPAPAGRWVDFSRRGEGFQLSGERLQAARALGAFAADFPNQTDSTGNISLRDGGEIIVTTSGCYIKRLEPWHFVRLEAVDGDVIEYTGAGVPSSESLMHWLVYQRTGAGAVVHTHYLLSNREAEALDVAIVPPQEYGSIAFARRVAEACQQRDIVYVQKHGLIFHGPTVAACLQRMEAFVTEALRRPHAA